uniref:Uncharacterized protein n=1 Tax=Romanomermis culicivorax TaxID=13658 RepID=A0A915KM61_ROMCU
VQQILHTLLDRHGNCHSLSKRITGADSIDDLNLITDKCPKVDAMFMRKNGFFIYSTLYKCAFAPGNKSENYGALLTTLLLLFAEVGCEEVIVDGYRFILALQSAALDENVNLSTFSRISLHNLVAKYFNLTAQLLVIPNLSQHVQQARTSDAIDGRLNLMKSCDENIDPLTYLLEKSPALKVPTPPDDPLPPSTDESGTQKLCDIVLPESALFDKGVIIESLQSRNLDVMLFSVPFVPRSTSSNLSVTDSAATTVADASSASLDIASLDSSSLEDATRRNSRRNTFLGTRMNNGIPAPVTVSMLRQLVNQPIEYFQKLEDERSKEITLMFRTLPYDQLVAKQRENCKDLGETLEKFFRIFDEKQTAVRSKNHKESGDIEFPDLFVY